jgi:predicted transcriptional regulator
MDTVAISVELPEETVRELDALAASRHCSRSEMLKQAVDRIVWQARIDAIPEDDPTPDEVAAIERGRKAHARGETVSLEEVLRDLDG